MMKKRIVSVGLLALFGATFATADFDGPAPLAWRWLQATSSSPVGSPTVGDGIVYGAVGSRMYALDKQTGNQIWKFPLVDPIPGTFKSSIILTEGLAIGAANNKTIYGVDAKTGESRWSYVAPAPIYREPVLAGKFIVFGTTDNQLMAINAADGMAAWQTPVKIFDGFMGKLASYQSNVYYFNNNYQLVSYSATTQKENWRQRFSVLGPDVEAFNLSDNLYVNSGTYVVGLSAVSGRKIFEGNANENLAFGPVSNGDTVFAVSEDGKAFILGSNGRIAVRKDIDLGSQPASSPSVAGKFYAVPTRNGAINLVDPKTGDIVWSYLVRPVGDQTAATNTSPGRGPGGGGPGAGGGGGLGGLGGGQNNQSQAVKVVAIPASGPIVVDGDTMLVLAQDGSLLAFDKNHGVDLTPPSVKMTWPTPGDLVSGQPPLQLVFKIEDEASGINTKTLKILVDGQEMENEFGRDGLAIVRISSLGKNKPFTDGRKTITVIVADWLGNETRKDFSLVIDNTLRPLQPPATTQPGQSGPGGGKGGGGVGGGGVGGGR
ncbi:MAG TPA: PQQ-binding-like beta-propeller repeat protein [Fimbriimonadaceae bacterium]|nr:PQQ-binding-like beta-propeller repeat protein [Fimbriimonadaceae bacterium]